MAWSRVRAADKLAWREDLQEDPTLSDLQKRILSVLGKHWDDERMHAECSLTFLATGAGTTKKMVNKYAPSLVDSGRVAIKQKASHTESTLWTVNWWFRGSAWVRLQNGGQPVTDCRDQSPSNARDQSPADTPPCNAGGPPSGGPIPSLTRGDIGAPSGSARLGGGLDAPREEEDTNHHKLPPGFAKWRVTGALYENEDTFLAHLRSGNGRKFVLRLPTASDEYEELDRTLFIDGEPESVVNKLLAMSTNRSGPKRFRRAAPLPWMHCTVLSGESDEAGAASVRVRFDDGETTLRLSSGDADRLTEACGGEAEAIGARVRYRLLPDDTKEFRIVGCPKMGLLNN